jgi:hypothetical protein
MQYSKLLAIIKGGQRKYAKVNESIIIDGSNSYYEDGGDLSGLAFNWTCSVISSSYNTSCPTSLIINL